MRFLRNLIFLAFALSSATACAQIATPLRFKNGATLLPLEYTAHCDGTTIVCTDDPVNRWTNLSAVAAPPPTTTLQQAYNNGAAGNQTILESTANLGVIIQDAAPSNNQSIFTVRDTTGAINLFDVNPSTAIITLGLGTVSFDPTVLPTITQGNAAVDTIGSTLTISSQRGGNFSASGAGHGGNISIAPGFTGTTSTGTPAIGGSLTLAGQQGGNAGAGGTGGTGGTASLKGGNGGLANNGSANPPGLGGTITVAGGVGGQSLGNGQASNTGGAGTFGGGAGGSGALAAGGGTGGAGNFTGGAGGAGSAGFAAGAGGNANVNGGAGGTNSGAGGNNGGNAFLDGGAATGAGTSGTANLGTVNASAVAIARSGITTTISGPIAFNHVFSSPVAPTVSSGFGSGASISFNNGTSVFRVAVGTSTATTGVIGLPTVTSNWNCICQNTTSVSATVFLTTQTSTSASSCTIGNFSAAAAGHAWADNDVLVCIAGAE